MEFQAFEWLLSEASAEHMRELKILFHPLQE
jgi:hypothetical protein